MATSTTVVAVFILAVLATMTFTVPLSILSTVRPVIQNAYGEVGDVVDQIDLGGIINPATVFCSIGVAFDGTNLYVDACGDGNIYKIDTDGNLVDTFDYDALSGGKLPNALAYDKERNGIWVGHQSCTFPDGMPISFWDFDDDSVTTMFTIPFSLINPATGSSFLGFCFVDGLAFNGNDAPGDVDPTNDEIWFSDDVNRNVGVFRPNGDLFNGLDASTVDPSLASNSGIAIGGDFVYLGNNGGGDVFRADKDSDPLAIVDQFESGDDRQEDMECDPVSFAPIEVMWVRTTPQGGSFPNVLTALEIEPGTCGFGGAPPVNGPPDAVDDTGETTVDTLVDVDVLANDSDPDGDTLTVDSITDPANGSVVDNGDGTVTYTPDPGFVGSDSFDYTISDGNGGTDTATVTIRVREGPEPPGDETCLNAVPTILGTNGDDVIYGTQGDDVIFGLGGNDSIYGLGGNDKICGGDGDDKLFGGGGEDTISGGNGDDRLFGGKGNDRLIGGPDNDQLFGSDGDDNLEGGDGDDNLFGQRGNDDLIGGPGIDRLDGSLTAEDAEIENDVCIQGEKNFDCG